MILIYRVHLISGEPQMDAHGIPEIVANFKLCEPSTLKDKAAEIILKVVGILISDQLNFGVNKYVISFLFLEQCGHLKHGKARYF